MVRKFRFVKNCLFWGNFVAQKGYEFKVEISQSEIDRNTSIKINDVHVPIRTLIHYGYIEEILPDEKPISSESDSILDYEKKYNIHEAVHLMKNHDVTMIDSHFKIEWKFKDGYRTLLGARSNTEIDYFFDDNFGVLDLLDLTFTLVKSVEDVKERWTEIETHKDLCSAIVNKKMIRLGDGKPSNEYNDKQIETLFSALSHGVFKIEYLQE